MKRRKPKIALVLGSGGARGLAHIGVIEELLSRGYDITSVAGTSMGALVGGIYAAGKLPDFKKWVLGIDKFRMFQLLDFSFRLDGMVKGQRIISTLKEMVPDLSIEALPIPFAAISTDMAAEREVVFDSGSLFDAIRASISLPAFFRPVHKSDMVLMDGGILNPLPINRVSRRRGDKVFAVDVNVPDDEKPLPVRRKVQAEDDDDSTFVEWLKRTFSSDSSDDGKADSSLYSPYGGSLLQASDMMIERISRLTVELYKPRLLIEVPAAAYGILEFYRAPEIMELGRAAAAQALDRYEE